MTCKPLPNLCRRLSGLLVWLLLMGPLAHAQLATVSGVVKDPAGNAIPGANVLVKDTNTGTITNSDGVYRIDVAPDAVLQFRFIGYTSQDIAVNNQTTVNVTLVEDVSTLSEVVVIGYGEVRKSDLTGSVGGVTAKDLSLTGISNITQALQGRIAGVQVNQSDGAPGAGISIQVRGANSFSSSTEPLYVIDGIPFTSGNSPTSNTERGERQMLNPMGFINPQDIESIQVLKDASATAIYGSRGANGVVLITTKKGRAGEDKIEFNVNYGISQVVKQMDMLKGYDYANYQLEGNRNYSTYEGVQYVNDFDGTWSVNSAGDSTYQPTPQDFLDGYLGGGTNWQDMIFQNGSTADYTLSASGGTDKGNYMISGNYFKQEGTIVGSGYDRLAVRANVNRNLKEWLTIGTSVQFGLGDYNMAKTNADDRGLIWSSLVFPPSQPIHSNSASGYSTISWLAPNPWMAINSTKNDFRNMTFFNANYIELKLLPYLKFRQNIGYNFSSWDRKAFYGKYTWEGQTFGGVAQVSSNTWAKNTYESLLSFDKTFATDHTINAVAGLTAEIENYEDESVEVRNFKLDVNGYNDLNAGSDRQQPRNFKGRNTLLSTLARVNYAYKDKYLLTASFRRDGSSKFTTNNKWATFKSFALAWKLSEEQFIQQLGVFSDLKLRGSYGETGNQSIGAYSTITKLTLGQAAFNGAIVSALVDGTPGNENLVWETTRQVDAGLDIGLMNGRVSLTVDVYKKETRDLLQQLQIPMSTGFASIQANFGTVENRGLELSLTGKVIARNTLQWDISGNIAFNRNEIRDLIDDQFAQRLGYAIDNIFIFRNGQPVGAVYGSVTDGFYDNEAEVMADPYYANLPVESREKTVRSKIGEQKYKDLDGVTGIGDGDRAIIGNTNPDYIFGLTNTINYKRFTLNFFLQGVMGNDIVNYNLANLRMGKYMNIPRFMYEGRWTAENPEGATQPKPNWSEARLWRFSDREIEDGSYVRMKNISLGYNWVPRFKHIQSIYVYGNITNLFTITDYSWYDPDVNGFGSDARRGVDLASYPSSRTYSLGLKVTL
ncbi:SusC/RagA family TonB-linked outer membrane protein [Dawidia soli]|uniref:TonB-dependent receptor n=1 Tax=Dawidia soli TaxID=2782352 RepID=A0AAP2DII3_9BACT|nr:TonB-dependent receptor [Dawidia soli]MBT1689997.1 TonB-dependent receptor [Dawidia soli]